MLGEAQIARRLGRHHHLLHRPLLPRLGVAVNLRWRKAVKGRIIGGMNRDQLALKMGGKLGDGDAVIGGDAR